MEGSEIPKYKMPRGESIDLGSSVEQDAVKLAKAVNEFKDIHGRHPNYLEIFNIIKNLGWKKVQPENNSKK